MSNKVISKFLHELLRQLDNLSDSDVKKLETGEYSLSLKVLKLSTTNVTKKEERNINYSEIVESLNNCDSREAGIAILNKTFFNKRELEQFAKYIKVYVMKQDRIEKVKDKIIEGTVGASLRSNAIQKNDG
ncbi:hypothetical protein NTE31_001123 [Vibrio cholerae]|nr:hypothetical protein [Vibrio cholerae]ELP3386075.1 hypothetical protein [Vibrio cholerae]ELR9908816.1 hypothetical protein [Vibrio cholerae]